MNSAERSETTGELIDKLGCVHIMKEGDLVVGAIVLMKIVESDGTVRMGQCWSEGMSWLERVGMLHAAQVLEDQHQGCE